MCIFISIGVICKQTAQNFLFKLVQSSSFAHLFPKKAALYVPPSCTCLRSSKLHLFTFLQEVKSHFITEHKYAGFLDKPFSS